MNKSEYDKFNNPVQPEDFGYSIRPRTWVIIAVMFVAVVVLHFWIGAMITKSDQKHRDKIAEQSQLLKLKDPIRMASEQAILATIWEKTQ